MIDINKNIQLKEEFRRGTGNLVSCIEVKTVRGVDTYVSKFTKIPIEKFKILPLYLARKFSLIHMLDLTPDEVKWLLSMPVTEVARLQTSLNRKMALKKAEKEEAERSAAQKPESESTSPRSKRSTKPNSKERTDADSNSK